MATQKQIQANRSNAQLSTGPRTGPGKAVSCRNALKTGIDARNETAAGTDPAVTRSPQTENPQIGFVPSTTPAPGERSRLRHENHPSSSQADCSETQHRTLPDQAPSQHDSWSHDS